MDIYLVGGAVRDQLLGINVQDRDYLVVGSSIDEMQALGYQQVGRDFPVFLHPQSHEEYALARIERKLGQGYTGFSCDSSADVTIEEDLLRRDLTINAMAMDESGQLVDPYNGQQDLQNRILRHVSPAFVEDPLRVLRVARFAARYHHLGFELAAETKTLMTTIAHSGELQLLTPERVWMELEKVLKANNTHVFFEVLKETQALKILFPELHNLFGVPAPARWHPEIDTGIHCLLVMQQASLLSSNPLVRFAAFCHDFGKAETPPEKWPSHQGHEKTGLPLITELCLRYKIPNDYKELALQVCEHHGKIHKVDELKASTVLKLFDICDAWRKSQRFEDMLLACEADYKGRTGFEKRSYPQRTYLAKLLTELSAIPVAQVIAAGYKGAAIREQLNKLRLDHIKAHPYKVPK